MLPQEGTATPSSPGFARVHPSSNGNPIFTRVRTPVGGNPLLARTHPLVGGNPLITRARPPVGGNPLLTRARPPVGGGNPLITKARPSPLVRRPPYSVPIRTPAPSYKPVSTFNKVSKWAAPDPGSGKDVNPPVVDDSDWISYKLTTTKASLLKGLRHHVIRMYSKNYDQVPDPKYPGQTIGIPREVGLLDPDQFSRPVRLHRRDPMGPLGGLKEAAAARLLAAEQGPIIDEEREALEAERAQKAASKAEIASKIAPYGPDNAKKARFKRKTEQVFRRDEGNIKMRYEESQPWFIEDCDNKNTWQGQREQGMSGGAFVALVGSEDGEGFNMIPIEKWYKFRELNKHKLTPEEALARRPGRNAKLPSWMKRTDVKFEEDERLTAEEMKLYMKHSGKMAKKVITSKGGEEIKAVTELEGMDYEDFFDNDDAGQVYGADGDEESEQKEISERIKKEQLNANSFDLRTELVYELSKAVEDKAAAATRAIGKKTKKALRKREGNYNYNSDSDSDPYATDKESEDEDEVVARAETEKRGVEARLKAEEEKKTAEAACEAKKVADTAERRVKAAGKRRELADKRKTEKALKGDISSAIPDGLIALGKKNNGKQPTTASAVETLLVRKRTSAEMSGSDSGSDTKFIKKPRVNAKVNNNPTLTKTVAPSSPGLMGPPAPRKAKRKSDGLPAEHLDTKRQKTSPEPPVSEAKQPKTPPVDPPLPVQVAVKQTTLSPITDEDMIAVLRAHADGATMKDIVAAFKGRMTKSKEDIAAMVARMKRVGTAGAVKGRFVIKAEYK